MLLERVETLLNRGLADSTLAASRATALEGRALCMQLQDSSFSVVARIEAGQLRLAAADADTTRSTAAASEADATVSGGALSLLSLTGPRREQLLRSGAVRIEGDAEVAGQFQALFALVRPDLEQELSRFVGATPAHALALAGNAVRQWLGRSAKRSVENTLEYFAHESALLVPGAEADQRQRAVEDLRDRLARLEAKLDHLPGESGGAGQ